MVVPLVGSDVTVGSLVPPFPPLVVVGSDVLPFVVGSSVAVSQSVSSSSSSLAVVAPPAREELESNNELSELLNPVVVETPAMEELGFNNELNQLPDSVVVSGSELLPALVVGSVLPPVVVVGLVLPPFVIVGLVLPPVVVGTMLVFEATGLDDSSSHSSSSSSGSELEELWEPLSDGSKSLTIPERIFPPVGVVEVELDDTGVLLTVDAVGSKLCDNDEDSPAIVCESLGVDDELEPGKMFDKIESRPP